MSPESGWRARPLGLENLAAAPVPSRHEGTPLPARVLTSPLEMTTRLSWLLALSDTITVLLVLATPEGRLKVACTPSPLAKGEPLPLPASVLAFHTHGGSAVIPTASQREGTKQGVAGAGVPPGQYSPARHSVALEALVEPAAQP